MPDVTILYITDNRLIQPVFEVCLHYLRKAAEDRPIVSVSQRPLDLGLNVCVGELPYVALSIDYQISRGLEYVDSPFVAVAEHDCVYTREHFSFIPPDREHFWYNDNCWLLQYRNPKYPEYDGMYSYVASRRVQSQLICGTDSLKSAISDKISILSDPAWGDKYPRGRIGEPGAVAYEKTRRLASPKTVQHLWKDIKNYITKYNARDFKTVVPNLDIRHGGNFTGQRRGTNRTFRLEPWGTMDHVFNVEEVSNTWRYTEDRLPQYS